MNNVLSENPFGAAFRADVARPLAPVDAVGAEPLNPAEAAVIATYEAEFQAAESNPLAELAGGVVVGSLCNIDFSKITEESYALGKSDKPAVAILTGHDARAFNQYLHSEQAARAAFAAKQHEMIWRSLLDDEDDDGDG